MTGGPAVYSREDGRSSFRAAGQCTDAYLSLQTFSSKRISENFGHELRKKG